MQPEYIINHQQSSDFIKRTFGIARLFSIIILVYVLTFEASNPSQRPTIIYTFLLASCFLVSIPIAKRLKNINLQFYIALIIYSICITSALAYSGGIFSITIILLYPLLTLLSTFSLSPTTPFIISAIIIIEYIICITFQYIGKFPTIRLRQTNIPKSLYIDVTLSFTMFMLFIAYISNRLTSALLEKNKELTNSLTKLKKLTTLDPLTEINNRRFLEEKFEEKLNYCKESGVPLSIILIDIDGLDEINHRFGYLAGDKALKQTAQLIYKSLSSDELLFRYGGDEFIILLPDININEAEKIGNNLRKKLITDNVFNYESIFIPLTACFGIASATMLGKLTINDFINHANAALNEAKNIGPASLFKINF